MELPPSCARRPQNLRLHSQALQGGLLDLEAVSETGLLAMSLTGLSAEDAGTRCMTMRCGMTCGAACLCGCPLLLQPVAAAAQLAIDCDLQLQCVICAMCRCSAAEVLRAVIPALEDAASLPRSLQPLEPLAPIVASALAPRSSSDAAGDAADTDAAAGTDIANGDGAAGAAGASAAAAAAAAAAGEDAPSRQPAITALLLAEVRRCMAPPKGG